MILPHERLGEEADEGFRNAFGQARRGEPIQITRPRGRRLDDSFYARVGAVYREAVGRGLKPRRAIADAAGVSPDVAGRWIYEARKRRLIPKTRPGKVTALMASAWITTRTTRAGERRFRVEWRAGGRESRTRYGGSFKRKADALARKAWIGGELAALRLPDFSILAEPVAAPTLRLVAERWQASRVDVRESTRIQHRTALGRVLPLLGDRPINALTPADVAELVGKLAGEGKARESIRKSITALAMVLDFAGIAPNPARDRVQVRLPLEEPDEQEAPSAEHVEAAGWLLTPAYLVAMLTLDATGCRTGELEAARVGDLDERRHAWLVRAAISKTRRARWVELPDDLYGVITARLPAPEDRDADAPLFPGVTSDRLRMAIARACRDAGVPRFNVHSLRHRYISLAHKRGDSWAEIGARVGQRSRVVTADRYSHALGDYREVNRTKLLERVRAVPTPVPTSDALTPRLAGAF